MARQGGQVHLKQSDMRVALNIAKTARGGFLRTAREETLLLIKKPCTEVQEEKKRSVGFPGFRKVKTVIERHLALHYENETDGCLHCKNGTTKHARTRFRPKAPGAPPQVRRNLPTPELQPPPPGKPPAPPGAHNGA